MLVHRRARRQGIGAALLAAGERSALSAGKLSVVAFVATNTAAAAAALAWMFLEWWDRGEPNVLGAASGAVAGLVGITPAAGFVTPSSAIFIGAGAGALCYLAVVKLRPALGYDDSLDTFGIHGVGGVWGALATGLFASKAVNEAGADGLFAGNPAQLAVQLTGVVATAVFAVVVSYVLLKVLDAAMGLRVSTPNSVETAYRIAKKNVMIKMVTRNPKPQMPERRPRATHMPTTATQAFKNMKDSPPMYL